MINGFLCSIIFFNFNQIDRMKLLLILVTLCSSFSAVSQNDLAASSDSILVRNTIDKLFEGMKTGDSTRVGSVFSADTRMISTYFSREGELKSQEGSLQEFKMAIGAQHKEVWDERISNVVIQIDDLLAQVWMDYSFYLDDKLLHCGVNAMQLIKSNDGWRIVHLIDSRRHERCE